MTPDGGFDILTTAGAPHSGGAAFAQTEATDLGAPELASMAEPRRAVAQAVVGVGVRVPPALPAGPRARLTWSRPARRAQLPGRAGWAGLSPPGASRSPGPGARFLVRIAPG